jgi:hypothetical protein
MGYGSNECNVQSPTPGAGGVRKPPDLEDPALASIDVDRAPASFDDDLELAPATIDFDLVTASGAPPEFPLRDLRWEATV